MTETLPPRKQVVFRQEADAVIRYLERETGLPDQHRALLIESIRENLIAIGFPRSGQPESETATSLFLPSTLIYLQQAADDRRIRQVTRELISGLLEFEHSGVEVPPLPSEESAELAGETLTERERALLQCIDDEGTLTDLGLFRRLVRKYGWRESDATEVLTLLNSLTARGFLSETDVRDTTRFELTYGAKKFISR